MATGILPFKQVEELVSVLPINKRAAILSHDAVLRSRAAGAGAGDDERMAVLQYLRRVGGDGTTVRGKYAHKLADEIEAGFHVTDQTNAA